MTLDIYLSISLVLGLVAYLFKVPYSVIFLAVLNILALLPVIKSAFKALQEKEISIDLLAAIALIFSFISKEWGSAAFINLMLASSRIFSAWTEKKTGDAIKSLLKYAPTKVNIREKDTLKEKSTSSLEIGDIMVVPMGARIATDGIILKGVSSIDESSITGESIPRSVKVGDEVYSATLNLSNMIEVKVTKRENENTLSKIILSIEAATLKKTKTIKMSSRFASVYVLTTLVASIFIYLITKNPHFTLSILLVVCADDLAVSIPLAFTMGIARATQKGIVINSSDVLEKLPKIKYFIADKTGTLTKGKIKIDKILNLSKSSDSELYKQLAQIESVSNHPISKEIITDLMDKGIEINPPKKFEEVPGEGIIVKDDSKLMMAGKIDFLRSKEIILSKKELDIIKKYQDTGFSISGIGIDKKLVGLVVFEDEVKTNAAKVINKTKELGVREWIMLTGDNEKVAAHISKEAGITIFKANLNPEDKLEFIKNFKAKKKELVAMVGDGINDTPALSLSDVSFAMGTIGSDVAIKASDVAIMNDNLENIPKAIEISSSVGKVVKQNIFLWILTNTIGLALVVAGVIGPTGAATYNFVTDFITTLNALRAGRIKS